MPGGETARPARPVCQTTTMMMIGSPFYSQKFAVRTITLLSVDPCIGHCEDLDSEGGKKS